MSSNRVRVRVEARSLPANANKDDKEYNFRKMFTIFKKACVDAGVLHSLKEHETFESKSRKKRRKGREAEVARLKAKIRENFLQGKVYNG